MRKLKVRLLLVCVLLLFVGAANGGHEGGVPKWSQPPTYNSGSLYPDCFWGWDEVSIYTVEPDAPLQIIADDWQSEDPRAVLGVHWWGSYLNYDNDTPPSAGPELFHIGIWTDVPAGGDQP